MSYSGYLRAPMRVGIGNDTVPRATAGANPVGPMSLHYPVIPDDQYGSWQFTGHNRKDWAEMFFTVGNGHIGTFKLGRDYGVFGSNAILGDMTLIGVGMPIQATQRGRVSLGHIGAGYTYLGHYGQIAWTSPAFAGGNVTLALMSPVDNGLAGTHDAGSSPRRPRAWHVPQTAPPSASRVLGMHSRPQATHRSLGRRWIA